GSSELDAIVDEIGSQLEAVWHDAPFSLRNLLDADMHALGARPGRALAESLVTRVADYRANLLAQRFLSLAERETYVRQNVRTLRGEFRSSQALRMLARYLYEYQYLRFSLVPDTRTFFLHSTWFEDDFFRPRLLDEARFDALAKS